MKLSGETRRLKRRWWQSSLLQVEYLQRVDYHGLSRGTKAYVGVWKKASPEDLILIKRMKNNGR
jgi:hypothetical protein